MGEERKRITKLPSYRDSARATRWIGMSYEGGREAADEHVGTDLWVSTEPDSGLLQTAMLLEEALRRLQEIEAYVSIYELPDRERPPRSFEADICAMARKGSWGRDVA
ncbi:hypothetical protein SEA_MOLLYMUR_106 [Gordonia phage Mollymur]|uniref:Uncharacterized protein n=1 Tax=Gordonia phage Mollymur TaxID=2590895 RepID=A0A4Y6EDR6_9CAUD|nr:hypothetical protein PQB84_gp020 [Gordonia phage Mollymur]QDF15466.1 hypothetical protein SEA_MOLLYMUR_106 [Gordonia phage Mollymur]